MYIMMGKDGFSQYASTYYLAQKYHGTAAFKRVPADVHDHGTPSLVDYA